MLQNILRTFVKLAIASLIVGTVLAHFGISIEQIAREFGFSPQRLVDMAQSAAAWALPNLLLGAVIILPVWFVVYLFRPPRRSTPE